MYINYTHLFLYILYIVQFWFYFLDQEMFILKLILLFSVLTGPSAAVKIRIRVPNSGFGSGKDENGTSNALNVKNYKNLVNAIKNHVTDEEIYIDVRIHQ